MRLNSISLLVTFVKVFGNAQAFSIQMFLAYPLSRILRVVTLNLNMSCLVYLPNPTLRKNRKEL
jgi:hypothetical protein